MTSVHVNPDIDAAHCSGCGRCIAACGLRLFAFETQAWKKISVLQDRERCNGCGQCVTHCPVQAIALRARTSAAQTGLRALELQLDFH